MITIPDFLEVLVDLNKDNPNKYTLKDRMALDYISRRTAEAVGFLQHQGDNEKNRLYIKCMNYIDAVRHDLSDSQLLKPINGLVIHKSRKRNARLLDEAINLFQLANKC